jgi:hypothetical protein
MKSPWHLFRFAPERHPNIVHDAPLIEGAITRQWLEELLAKCGGNTEHPDYVARGLGEFPDEDAIQVFRPEACVSDKARCDGAPQKGHRYVSAFDLAKHQDYTWGGALDLKTNAVVCMEVWQRIPWPDTERRILAFSRRWKGQMWIDATGVGDGVYDHLIAGGMNIPHRHPEIPGVYRDGRKRARNSKYGDLIGYNITNTSKANMVTQLRIALEQGAILLPGDPDRPWSDWPDGDAKELLKQLIHYQAKYTQAGNVSYNAPVGEHDDGVIFLMLANMARQNPIPRSNPSITFLREEKPDPQEAAWSGGGWEQWQ